MRTQEQGAVAGERPQAGKNRRLSANGRLLQRLKEGDTFGAKGLPEKEIAMKMIHGRILAAIALTAISSMPARAHSYLVDSVPTQKQEVMNPLKEIKLVFSGKVDALFSSAELMDESGAVLAQITPTRAARQITLPAPELPLGRYRVHYRILSADGDVVEGALAFTVARVDA
jgi:copper resistance protein C